MARPREEMGKGTRIDHGTGDAPTGGHATGGGPPRRTTTRHYARRAATRAQ